MLIPIIAMSIIGNSYPVVGGVCPDNVEVGVVSTAGDISVMGLGVMVSDADGVASPRTCVPLFKIVNV